MLDKMVYVLHQAHRHIKRHTTRSNISRMHPSARNSLVKFHHFFTFFKEPEKWCQGSNIKGMGSHSHNMIENSRNFPEQGSDIFGAFRHFNSHEVLNDKRICLLIAHHRYVIQSIKIRQSLEISFVFNEFFCTSV